MPSSLRNLKEFDLPWRSGLVLAKKYGYIAVVARVRVSCPEKPALTTGDMLETIKGVATRNAVAYANLLYGATPRKSVDLGCSGVRGSAQADIGASVIHTGSRGEMLDGAGWLIRRTVAREVPEISRDIDDLQRKGEKS